MGNYAHSLDSWEPAPPESQALYINRPLPAPPISPRKPSRDSNRSVPPPIAQPMAKRSLTARSQSPEHLACEPVISHRSGISLSDSPTPDKQSSLVANQLNSHNVGICFDWSPDTGFSNYVSPVFLGDENTSNNRYSWEDAISGEEEERHSVPTLVLDSDDTWSKRSSGGPLSPRAISGSSVRGDERDVYGYAPDSPSPLESPTGHRLDENDSITNSYNYLSDTEAADEYHRFTTDLAKFDKQKVRRMTAPTVPLHRSQSLSRRISVSARSLFSRRRESVQGGDLFNNSLMDAPRSHPELGQQVQPPQVPRSEKPIVPPRPVSALPNDALMATPRSVFEYSDDEESNDKETRTRGAFRDFFSSSRRRSEEKRRLGAQKLDKKSRRQNLKINIQVIPE
ncbi:hypothetical protein BGZ63DRAFT_128320 [Mariannaea sp. PMI_226]|nr:hypothetical protein BGZ63DRAFT_128320 [Mariannaea sp. PMI_226]